MLKLSKFVMAAGVVLEYKKQDPLNKNSQIVFCFLKGIVFKASLRDTVG